MSAVRGGSPFDGVASIQKATTHFALTKALVTRRLPTKGTKVDQDFNRSLAQPRSCSFRDGGVTLRRIRID
ncbi:hypothetical protein O9929_12505 [Vibrio lentus]|nr:hypothetical protein [Vibrio lentus]